MQRANVNATEHAKGAAAQCRHRKTHRTKKRQFRTPSTSDDDIKLTSKCIPQINTSTTREMVHDYGWEAEVRGILHPEEAAEVQEYDHLDPFYGDDAP